MFTQRRRTVQCSLGLVHVVKKPVFWFGEFSVNAPFANRSRGAFKNRIML